MGNKLKAGQIVRFKNYKKKKLEPEAYFIVLITEDINNNCWVQVINSNREYETGTALSPLYLEDLEVVTVQAKELVYQEITIKITIFQDFAADYVYSVDDEDSFLIFTAVDGGFESNAIYTMDTGVINGKYLLKCLNF